LQTQFHVLELKSLRKEPLECRMIIVGGEDGHAGVAPIQGVINEAAFRSAWWSRHAPRLRKQAPDVKIGS